MKNNKIILSIVVSSLLFTQSYALPSGGKFTHGTSGSISVSGGTMNISGSKTNSVIQWGGGFNIAKGETVNFGQGKTNQNYLNIAYGTKSSTIDGLLNATGNNVYLINPNGVVIGKSGTINANKFGVSTSSIDSKAMQEFADNANNPVFSPVFKPNNKGNVINMGNINANDVLIIGNEVYLNSSVNSKDKILNKIDSDSIWLIGNTVQANIGTLDVKDSLKITAIKNGALNLDAKAYYFNPIAYNNFSKYQGVDYGSFKHNTKEFKTNKFVGIGSDEDWFYFSKGWNENKNGFRDYADEYRLTNDIDFFLGGGNQGKDFGKYTVDGETINMMVGYDLTNAFSNYQSFTKVFDGQGFTLKNIYFKPQGSMWIGLFARVDGGEIKNLNVENFTLGNGDGSYNFANLGALVGSLDNGSKVSNVKMKNISFKTGGRNLGTIAGRIYGNANLENIVLENINIDNKIGVNFTSTGSVVGFAMNGTFNNIYVDGITIKAAATAGMTTGGDIGESHVGGFIGHSDYGTFTNIYLNNIDLTNNYARGSESAYVGGFIGGSAESGRNSGSGDTSTFENIFIYFTPDATIQGKSGIFYSTQSEGSVNFTFKNTHIYQKKNSLSNANTDSSFTNIIEINGEKEDKVNIHYYTEGDNSHNDFLTQAKPITKPNIPTNTPSSSQEPSENVILDQDDLHNDIVKEIIENLNDEYYRVNIFALKDLLNNYIYYSTMNEDEKTQFILTYFIDKENDKYAKYNKEDFNNLARNLVQSMDFIMEYNNNNLDNAKFDSDDTKNSYFNTIHQLRQNITNKNTLFAFLKGDLKSIKDNYDQFVSTKEDLDKTIDAYNAYVALINQDAASSKDAEFISLKNKVNELYAKAQGYLDTYKFDDTLKSYKTQALSQSNNHFSIKGEFDTKLASLDSVLDKPNNEGGDTSNPEANAPLPFSEALLTQMDESVLKQDEDDKEP
ncbi:two-partner secretion domain-containing protein, partial [Campylobacter jejuni]|uniref:two-partner secretion domain-containing protein n=4 Tax=Campylobacter jejuni TaxID=197 RepID=UPI00156690A9